MPQNFDIKTTFRAVDKSTRAIGKIQSKMMRFTSSVSMGMRKLDRVMSRVTGTVTRGLKYGFAAASGVAIGLYMAINKTAASMDQLAKRARTIDFPIEEFQEWRFVAEQSGVSTDVFEKSMQKFARVIGDAKNKTGSLYSILKKNDRGLLKTAMRTNNTAEAFEIMVEAIRKVEDPTKKASLAAATFGRAGVDMINMANLGANEIKKLREQMRENGVVTAEQAAKAEAYVDIMNRVKKTIGGLMVEVLTPLMPIITDLADRARAWAVANKDVITEKFQKGIRWVIDNFQTLVKWGKRIAAAIAVFYGLSAAIKVVNVAMTILNAVAAANPIVLIVIAVAAAVAAIIIFRKELIQFTIGVIKKIKEVAGNIKKFFKDPIPYIIKALNYLKKNAISIFRSLWNKIKYIGRIAIANFKDTFGILADLVTGDWEGAEKKLISIWSRIKNAAKSVLNTIKSFLQPIIDAISFVVKWHDKTYERDTTPAVGGTLGEAAKSVSESASVVPHVVRPSVSLSRHEESSTKHEDVEVTIQDKTGRAHVTKGSSGRVKLAHTGGMP